MQYCLYIKPRLELFENLMAIDADGNNLALDDWEVSEIINIGRYAKLLWDEKGEDFRLKDIDVALFENFKLSPAYTQI